MRLYEWISLVFYAAFAVLAWQRPLSLRRRSLVTAIAVAGIAGILRLRSTAARDWLPLAFIPLAYWQTGLFLRPLNNWLQSKLKSFDRKHLGRRSPPFMWLLEMCYLFCYPAVPLGLVTLYLSGMGRFAEEFWNVVIPPAYACYATFPFVRTLPPRAIERDTPWQPQQTSVRNLNLFVLSHVSIQDNTFPSGHVAASLAVALELLSHFPPAGFLFLLLSIAIAAGALWGRYHYGLDVLLGALLAIASFLTAPHVR